VCAEKAGVSPGIKHSSNLRLNQQFCFEICELCDVFYQKTGTKYFPGPWMSSTENMEDNSRFFCWAEKTNQNRIYKKNTLSQCAVSYFFTTEAAEVKRAGGNEKIARFDHIVRSIVT